MTASFAHTFCASSIRPNHANMSAAADDSQKPKKQCVVFEPQAWRKTLCRNCFKTKKDHDSSSDADDQQQKPTSPVVSDGDVVILRREGTPMKDSSRGSTPTASSAPATRCASPAEKNILVPEQDTSTSTGTIKEASSDKGKDKTCSEVDKNSHLNKASTATTANNVQTKSKSANVKVAKDKVQKAEVNNKKSDEGNTLTVDSEQCADSKPATDQQSTTAAISNSVENNKAFVDTRGHTAAFEAATSATDPVAVDTAVNSSAAIKLPDEDGAVTSVSAAARPQRAVESSLAENSRHDNASSPQRTLTEVGQIDAQTADDTSDATVSTREQASDEDGSSSSTITRCIDDAAASAVAAAAAASEPSSRSSETSDEIIGDLARSAEAGRADDTKIDHGSGQQSAADSMVGVDVATVPGASLQVNAGLTEDSEAVRQLDLTPDQRVDACAAGIPGVQSGLFTKDDVAKSVDAGSDTTSTSSISLATAADDAGAASVQQQTSDLFVDISAVAGHDFVPEVTSWNSAAGPAKVEATITLSGSSSPYVADNSRPIHVVSAAGISGYQRGGGASQNVENLAVGTERGRLPPDYEQSAGYLSSSVSDDEYGPTSPLVEYLAQSPFARSLHGATERSPETEIVATGGGGETSLFHHVPADDDESATAAAEASNDTRDWESGQSRDGSAVRLAANADTDNRLIHTCRRVPLYLISVLLS